jgi:electron transfer flavoprotein beta subunit
VVDYAAKIRVKSDKTGVDTSSVKMSLNPFDEVSMEQAVQLKEKGIVSEIISVTMGPAACSETLRTALAFGADRGIHVETDAELQPLAVAKLLAKVVEKEQPEMVILGKQAIDDDSNQTGQLLAGLLGWPQGTFLSKLEVDTASKGVKLTREVDGGLESLTMDLPSIVTCDLRLNTPRFLAIQNIMKARKKPIDKLKPEDLGVDFEPRLKTTVVDEPPVRKAGVKIGSVEELIAGLKKGGVL